MNTPANKATEKINKGSITSDNKGTLEFALTIKKEELEKFFNSYLHRLEAKNKNKDILLISANEKAKPLLLEIKDILIHFNQSVVLTDPATLGMAELLVKNASFRELLYIFLDEKTQVFKIILTKNKRKLGSQNLFDLIQNMNLFYPRSFNLASCNYIKNDIEYKKEIVATINSISLALKKVENNPPPVPEKTIFFETENAYIKNETSRILSLFGLKICTTAASANFVFKVDASGEKIEAIRYQNQSLDRALYLSYLHQKSIRKKLKIYIKDKNIYFLSCNLPLISRFSRKLKDVLCEVYLFASLQETKAFLEYARKNNFVDS